MPDPVYKSLPRSAVSVPLLVPQPPSLILPSLHMICLKRHRWIPPINSSLFPGQVSADGGGTLALRGMQHGQLPERWRKGSPTQILLTAWEESPRERHSLFLGGSFPIHDSLTAKAAHGLMVLELLLLYIRMVLSNPWSGNDLHHLALALSFSFMLTSDHVNLHPSCHHIASERICIIPPLLASWVLKPARGATGD